MSDTHRVTGFEANMTLVQALAPQAIADATPVLSSAIDTRSYPRQRMLLIAENKENGATTHTIAFTVTESATSDGVYTAATTTGTLTAISADGVQWAAIKRNKAMPFIKVTATGSHGDVDVICAASVLFIGKI
jgi:hypothetical protein